MVVFAAQAAGLALAGLPGFATFTALSATDFTHAVAVATGVNETVIGQWLTNWTTFYTGNPSATQGLSVSQAAYGATFGNAIGVALLNPTSANLQTVVTDTDISGVIANALLDNAWPAPGSEDTELGVILEPEVVYGTQTLCTRIQA